ncbi:hypothetical protein D3C83_52060 [compost metagenome]
MSALAVRRSATYFSARCTTRDICDAIGFRVTTVMPVSRSFTFSWLPTTVGATSPASSGTATWNVPSKIDSPVFDVRHSSSVRP